MGFSRALIFVSAVIVSSSGFAIENGEPLCPSPEQVDPCTCDKVSGKVTAVCKDITYLDDIRDVFYKNPDWKIQDVHFDQCVFNYIPSSIVKEASFEQLNVTSSTLVSLFDAVPVIIPEIRVFLTNVKILRGIQWELFSNSTLLALRVQNVDVPTIGKSFREHMPEVVKYLWFQNTKTEKIKDQAFQRMVNLDILTLMGGSLKKLTRDMFPRPWNIKVLNIRKQKLAELPKDFFADLPYLQLFNAQGNYFTTLVEEVWRTKGGLSYVLIGNPINCNCRVKWIGTAGKDRGIIFSGTCAEPESLKGRGLESLTEEDFKYCR